MTPTERRLFERLDRLVLDASADELKKIQETDVQTQLDGISFYEVFSKRGRSPSIRQKSRK